MTWEWPSSYGWAVPVPTDFDPEEDVRKALESAVAPVRAAHPDITVDPRVVSGHPAPILVEASKGAELLVVGCRGHGEFVGMLIGSVSEYCATNAHCPVLVHRRNVVTITRSGRAPPGRCRHRPSHGPASAWTRSMARCRSERSAWSCDIPGPPDVGAGRWPRTPSSAPSVASTEDSSATGL